MVRKTGNIWISTAKIVLFFVVLAIFFAGQRIFYTETVFYFWGNYIILLLYAANIYFTCRLYNGFNIGNADLQEIIISWILCLIISNILQYLILSLLVSRMLPVAGTLAVLAAQLILVIPLTILIDKLYYRLNPAHKAIIIYGDAEKAHAYREIIEKHREKFEIDRIVPQDETTETMLQYLAEAESVFFLDIDEKIQEHLLEYCFRQNKRAYIMPTFIGVLLNTAGISWISDTPMFLPRSPELDTGMRLVKRCMDIIISLIFIVLSSWLMLLTCIAIRLYDRGPAIYKQVRVTKGGKQFTLYKFRSMRTDAEADGIPRLSTEKDERVTPIGRIIRKTRIDELPQFFNVLGGSMSIVGPRPERPEIARQYEEIYPEFSLRTKVKAGITGFAQIYGNYSSAPDEKLFLDIMYIETFSIWQDLKLIMQTLKVIFTSSSTEGIPDDATTALTRTSRKQHRRI